MTKLFLIIALMTLSFSALAQEIVRPDTANENCDVSVVPTGGEADVSANPSGGTGTEVAPR